MLHEWNRGIAGSCAVTTFGFYAAGRASDDYHPVDKA
jgi:hypothetical protein